MLKPIIVLLFLSAGSSRLGECQIMDSIGVLKTFIEKFNLVIDSKNNMQGVFEIITSSGSPDSVAIMENLKLIEDKVTHLEQYLENKLTNIADSLRHLEHQIIIIPKITKLAKYIEFVNIIFRQFLRFRDKPKEISNSLLEEFYNENYAKLKELTRSIQIDIAAEPIPQHAALTALIARDTRANAMNNCGSSSNPQQILINLFMIIMQTETKAMTILTFFTKLKHPSQQEWNNFGSELEIQFRERYNAYVYYFSRDLKEALREHRSCDPTDGWVRDTSYFELEGFIQATIIRIQRAYSLGDYVKNTCEVHSIRAESRRKLCAEHGVEQCYEFEKEVCRGTMDHRGCIEVSNVERCWKLDISHRTRFLWLHVLNGDYKYGKVDDGCQDHLTKENYGYCICQCTEPRYRVRLSSALSDLTKGRVVTGIKFALENRIIFIQMREGTLGPNGTITENFNQWKPSYPPSGPDLVLNDANKAFNIDNLMGDDDEVLTGIGFTKANDDSNNKVQLQIEVTKFEYSTGRMPGRSRNISATNPHNYELKIGDYDSVGQRLTNTPDATFRDAPSKHYVKFHQSPLNSRSDAGQTTLPLFDSVPVEGSPPCPLNGAGLFHKGAPNYAGFLSMKVFVINYGRYFSETIKPIAGF